MEIIKRAPLHYNTSLSMLHNTWKSVTVTWNHAASLPRHVGKCNVSLVLTISMDSIWLTYVIIGTSTSVFVQMLCTAHPGSLCRVGTLRQRRRIAWRVGFPSDVCDCKCQRTRNMPESTAEPNLRQWRSVQLDWIVHLCSLYCPGTVRKSRQSTWPI